ncbi:MAG: cation transporter [Elusimicrobia bacterium]|nr:cation transporter [Elusimicrobiota bacterium]
MEFSHENPHSAKAFKPLIFASILTFGYFVIELLGGLFTKSLALIADSSHMAGDFFSLALALFANYLARRPINAGKTYGYHRVEVLAGLFNAMTLWVISGMIAMNALGRLRNPPVINIDLMMPIAALGLAVNIACALLLKYNARTNINVRGAYLNVLSDALGSIGTIVAGLLIYATGNPAFDAIISGFICVLIIASSLKLMLNSLNILLEGAPSHLDVEKIRLELLAVDGIKEVHDLHVWSLGSGMDMLSGHIRIHVNGDKRILAVVETAAARLRERFGIEHTTLQPEPAASKIV